MSSLKQLKEAWVTGNTGGGLIEVILIGFLPVLQLALYYSLPTPTYPWIDICLQFLLLIASQIAVQLSIVTPMTVILLLLLLLLSSHNNKPAPKQQQQQHSQQPIITRALADYRASLMIITCVAILGVDYPAFPRRFAKTETFGTALMDAGVGSIIVAGALTRGLYSTSSSTSSHDPVPKTFRSSSKGPSYLIKNNKSLIQTATLLTLAIARIIATSAVDYQHHTGEYGVHWNFFMTLAGLRILHSAFYYLSTVLPKQSSSLRAILLPLIVGIATLTVYQITLSKYGLIEYIHSDDRDLNSITSANKEGIFSLIGYWSLHLLGVAIGTFIQTAADDDNNNNNNNRITRQGMSARQKRVVMIGEKRLWMIDVILWVLYACISTWIQPVSRRACNAAYVVWMLALNVLCLGGFVAVERKLNTCSNNNNSNNNNNNNGGKNGGGNIVEAPTNLLASSSSSGSGSGSVLLQAIGGSLLPVFLVANVLTGVVNMCSDTLSAEKSTAVVVVMVYMALVCLVALGMMKIV